MRLSNLQGRPEIRRRDGGAGRRAAVGSQACSRVIERSWEKVCFNHVPVAALRASMVPGADLAANMFQVITENLEKYCAHYDVPLSRSLNPRLQSFANWLAAHVHQLSMPTGSR